MRYDEFMYSRDQDAPLITQFKSTTPHARKEYVCGICRDKISIGEKHLKIVYRDDEVTPAKMVNLRQHLKPCDIDPEDMPVPSYP